MVDNPCSQEASGRARGRLHAALLRVVCPLLRVPLFLKILLANAVIPGLAVAATLMVAGKVLGESSDTGVLALLAVFLLAALLVGAALNAVVVRVALSPLALLSGTAERVSGGELRARTPDSALADRPTKQVVSVFNRMLDNVQSAHERQQELALRVLQAEERERERVAHELYAGTAQTLAGVLVRLRVAERNATCHHCGVPQEVRDQVAQALEEIRSLARRLRPPELDELGIRPALEAHARTLTEGRSIRVRIRGDVAEGSITRDAALALFRIVQEAITNAVLHSGGRQVEVGFLSQQKGLLAEIVDDGAGFDVRDLFSGTDPNLGVTGMRERAVYVGGTFSIDSAPGEGTRVRVLMPWIDSPWRERHLGENGDLAAVADPAVVRQLTGTGPEDQSLGIAS